MADTTRTLFDGKSYTNLSKPEMIRDLSQQGCQKTCDVPGQCTTLNLALDRHMKENHSHDHSRNQRSTVLGLS